MSNYPRDEFDNIPESSSRQGVHRTAMAAPRRSLWPIIVFAVVALVIGGVAFFAISKLPGSAPDTQAKPSSSSTSASTNSPTNSTPTSPPATVSASPTTSAPPPPPPVDKTQPVNVYNATLTSGLGARVSQQVRNDGWTVGATSNWQGPAQPSSVIFYNGPTQKPNADELGKLLGITRLVDTADLGIPLAVVLGPGAQ